MRKIFLLKNDFSLSSLKEKKWHTHMSENSIKFPNLAEFFGLDYIILLCGVCG